MYDGGKIIAGLIIFLLLVTLPIWINLASGGPVPLPEPKIVTDAENCVEARDYMRSSHMALLNEWRDLAVREGKRMYVGFDGTSHNMSLTNTCLDCHSNKAEFCDECHEYAAVTPYCWECHLESAKESN